MATDLSAFHRTFFDESLEGVDIMESGLLSLHSGVDTSDAINAVFRAAHSIKGGAGTFGFTRVASFTHILETRLDEMREGRLPIDAPIVEALLATVDVLRGLLLASQADAAIDEAAVASAEARLAVFAASPSGPMAAAAPVAPSPSTSWLIEFVPNASLFATGNDPYRLLRELSALGEAEITADFTRLPSLAAMDPERCYLSWTIRLTGEALTEAGIREVFEWVVDDCELSVTAVRDSLQTSDAPVRAAAASGAAPSPRAATPAAESASIRVNTDKVDALVNLIGELVITQSMLSQIGHDFEPSRLPKLLEGLGQLERNTRDLQESVMSIRMVPIGFAFSRFPRMIHDISRQLGKQVELRMSGEQTELDKTVIEKITDPLVHLVRNSLDHGLETPEAREAAGKSPVGHVILNAYHRGGEIIIEVGDDGRGLNRERIREKAIARQLITADEVLTDSRLLSLVFEPGFSTAEAVTDLSGRGVGLDVVRRNISALGGTIDVHSVEGEGTTVLVRLPLTLAILEGQLLRVGAQTLVVPLASVVESIVLRTERVNRVVGEAEVYRLGEELMPMLRLADAFGFPPATHDESLLLMVLEADGRRAGVVINELLAQQQVVIKSLETNYRQVPGVSGATILGDGSVALILDPPALLQRVAVPRTDREPRRSQAA